MTKMRKHLISCAVIAAALSLTVAVPVLAGDGSGTDLSWWTADAGGAVSEGGGYRLGGTVGQPDAGVLTGGEYMLSGGFWAGAAAKYPAYLPMVVRAAG
jgi:hypothetical protein